MCQRGKGRGGAAVGQFVDASIRLNCVFHAPAQALHLVFLQLQAPVLVDSLETIKAGHADRRGLVHGPGWGFDL